MTFPFTCSKIPEGHALGVFISLFIEYYKTGGVYQDFRPQLNVAVSKKFTEQRIHSDPVQIIT